MLQNSEMSGYEINFCLLLFIVFYTDISCLWEGYLRKKRKISQAEWQGKFSLKTGIFRKYPSQT